jgi:hypothetical protein
MTQLIGGGVSRGGFFIVVCFGVALTTVAQAATINVPADHRTIQAAVKAAVDGDTIVVSADYVGAGALVDKSVAIMGNGALINKLGAKARNEAFLVLASDVEIHDFTIDVGAKAIFGINLPSVTNCTISGNTITAPPLGVALYTRGGSNCTISGNTFKTGEQKTEIGICLIGASDIEISGHNTFSGNYMWDPIFAYLSNNVTVDDNIFEDVNADWDASILLQRCTNGSITNNTFTDCYGYEAGGVWLLNTVGVEVIGNDFNTVSGPAVSIGDYWGQPSENNTIMGNDYTDSGLPGLPGAFCVDLGVAYGPVAGNYVYEPFDPTGTSGDQFPPGSNLCTQVVDASDNLDTHPYDGLNAIEKYNQCTASPNWPSILEHLRGVEPGTPPERLEKSVILLEQ